MVGNNPIAVALPSTGEFPVEADMALSATAMGKIRLAAAAGQPIPEDWAIDAEGRPTTDPAAAIRACCCRRRDRRVRSRLRHRSLRRLSDGAVGAEVRPLYGDPADPYRAAISSGDPTPVTSRRRPLRAAGP